jgi:two-component system sensor histidine kinase/response regulator
LLAVIQGILELSELDRGAVRLEATAFSLREIIADTLKPLVARAEGKGLAVTVEMDRAIPEAIVGDPSRLRQIIGHLVSNAIKFTEKGEVRVLANVEAASVLDAQVRISVADSGIGIPEAKQATIFDAFSQGDNSFTRQYGGTGLGLTISSMLVRLMGGSLGVQSTPGVGSTFYFTLRFDLATDEKRVAG